MSTLFARILRLGWLGSILLTLVAVAVIGIAVVVSIARPAAGTPTATAPSRHMPFSVSVTTTAQVVPTDLSHRPAAYHEFIAVTVQLTNTGASTVDYDVSAFLLRDHEGNTFSPDPAGSSLVGAGALPLYGTLKPGEHSRGALVFAVPMSDHTATLLWPLAGASWMLSI